MRTLRQQLQDADPIRHEVPPSLERLRQRIESMGEPAVVARPSRTRRGFFTVIPACVGVALVSVWAGDRGTWPPATSVAAQVRFEVRLAEDRPAAGLQVAAVANGGPFIYLHPQTVVGNDDLALAWVVDDDTSGFGVGVQLLPEGAERMRHATAHHVGRPVAMLIDGTVVMAPIVRSPIGDAAVIDGPFTREEATRIAAGIERR